MTENEYSLTLRDKIIIALRLVYDPEIPVNIYELGLVYEINIDDSKNVEIVMTLTAPNCPEAEMIPVHVEEAVRQVHEVNDVTVRIVFEPQWTMENMSDEAKLELGLL